MYLRFMFFGVVAPGRTHDSMAIHLAEGLLDVINNLPDGMYVVADAVYVLSEHLLIPFTGCMADNPDRDAYNFYLSQLRIRIEMAFGRMVRNFGILRRTLETNVRNTTSILLACATLHNFIIDEDVIPFLSDNTEDTTSASNDESDEDEIERNPMQIENRRSVRVPAGMNVPEGMEYRPTMPEGVELEQVEGFSNLRMQIIDEIKTNMIRRPHYNIQRNQRRRERESRTFLGVNEEYFSPR